jgi:hypothetical protein
MADTPAPQLVHVADLKATVAPAIEVSAGRRVIAITGGEISGPRINGVILPGGADFQVIRPDGVIELTARYAIRTDSGAMIYVENSGLRHGPLGAMERLRKGQPVDSREIYFRTTPRFETSAPEYQWLAKHIFVGMAVRLPDAVAISFYQLL